MNKHVCVGGRQLQVAGRTWPVASTHGAIPSSFQGGQENCFSGRKGKLLFREERKIAFQGGKENCGEREYAGQAVGRVPAGWCSAPCFSDFRGYARNGGSA
eukprot:363881-Chlamydomonas_euryale.AAC.2